MSEAASYEPSAERGYGRLQEMELEVKKHKKAAELATEKSVVPSIHSAFSAVTCLVSPHASCLMSPMPHVASSRFGTLTAPFVKSCPLPSCPFRCDRQKCEAELLKQAFEAAKLVAIAEAVKEFKVWIELTHSQSLQT